MDEFVLHLEGEEIDEVLRKVANGEYVERTELDEYVTEEELEGKGYAVARNVANALATKVTAVKGKGLSTEDFTTELKTKLEALSNYDDSEIAEAVEKLRSDIDTLVDGDTTKAIESFNEIIAFLKGIKDSQSLESIIASIEAQIASKQDTIADLSTIRDGASKGASAVQPSELASVAKSGLYDDLKNKPTIPSAVTESTISGWGFTKNNGDYSKPSGGIPKTDLADSVQTSLSKADDALSKSGGTVKGKLIVENNYIKSMRSSVATFFNIASFTSHQLNNVGTLVINLWNANMFMEMDFSIAGYNLLWDLKLSGYTYSSSNTFHSPMAMGLFRGITPKLRAAINPDGVRCFLLGDVDTEWGGYIRMSVYKYMCTASGANESSNPNVTISLITDESGYSSIKELPINDINVNNYLKYEAQDIDEEAQGVARGNIGALGVGDFKTINGNSIIGAGDITIEGGGSSSADIIASQIFLEMHTNGDLGNGAYRLKDKTGYEQHNLDVYKRMVANIRGARDANNEMFFATINTNIGAMPYMYSALLNCENGEQVYGSFVFNDSSNDSLGGSIASISVDAEVLVQAAINGLLGEITWKLTTKAIPSKEYVDSLKVGSVYLADIDYDTLISGAKVPITTALIEAMINRNVIIFASKRLSKYLVADVLNCNAVNKPIGITLRFYDGSKEYNVTIASSEVATASGVLCVPAVYTQEVVYTTGLKTINSESIVGRGDITIGGNVQGDWDEDDSSSPSYINNRTHYFNAYGVEQLNVDDSTIGTIVSPVTEVFSLGGVLYRAASMLGVEFNCQMSGPSVIVTVVMEDEAYYLKHISGNSSYGYPIYLSGGSAKQISDPYIPDTIARVSYVDTLLGNIITKPNVEEVTGTDVNIGLTPNVIYALQNPITSLTISGLRLSDEPIDEYTVHFFTGNTGGALTITTNVVWANGEVPSLTPDTQYELSIVRLKLGKTIVFKAVLTPFK